MLQLSQRIPHLQASPIREILAVITRPGMISFAGGLPSPASFPQLQPPTLPDHMLQYGASEGEPELRAQFCTEMQAIGLNCKREQVLVFSGSQQGIDLCAKHFVDHNTPLALEKEPHGGLFIWLKLKTRTETQVLLQPAIARGVAFMPGEPFFHRQQETSYLRLNFSHASENEMAAGLAVLGELLTTGKEGPEYNDSSSRTRG
jgi:DNA-binding transcriptional MocR family regulator